MASQINSIAAKRKSRMTKAAYAALRVRAVPRRSVVQVHFAQRNMTLSYYNDRFELHCGDIVYVDGKLEGIRGRVTGVNYNFKINVADYKRVIAVADTAVNGQFFLAGSHIITFNRTALPSRKVATWFLAPTKAGDSFFIGTDDSAFVLDDLENLKVSSTTAERGHGYYSEKRVRYISVDGTRGYAIVEGTRAYEVEFSYCGGIVSHLVCSCFCSGDCKHEVAAMLQLQETLELIEKHYADEYQHTGYFAAVHKGTLFSNTIDGKETGTLVLET